MSSNSADQDTILDASLALITEAMADITPSPVPSTTYTGVALYRLQIFGISRKDCSSLTTRRCGTGTEITFTEKGKRKPTVCVVNRWFAVVPLAQAIEPQDPLVIGPDGVQVSRYPGWDPRWVSDFEAKMGLNSETNKYTPKNG